MILQQAGLKLCPAFTEVHAEFTDMFHIVALTILFDITHLDVTRQNKKGSVYLTYDVPLKKAETLDRENLDFCMHVMWH